MFVTAEGEGGVGGNEKNAGLLPQWAPWGRPPLLPLYRPRFRPWPQLWPRPPAPVAAGSLSPTSQKGAEETKGQRLTKHVRVNLYVILSESNSDQLYQTGEPQLISDQCPHIIPGRLLQLHFHPKRVQNTIFKSFDRSLRFISFLKTHFFFKLVFGYRLRLSYFVALLASCSECFFNREALCDLLREKMPYQVNHLLTELFFPPCVQSLRDCTQAATLEEAAEADFHFGWNTTCHLPPTALTAVALTARATFSWFKTAWEVFSSTPCPHRQHWLAKTHAYMRTAARVQIRRWQAEWRQS